jgi:integrase/recombinase XerD
MATVPYVLKRCNPPCFRTGEVPCHHLNKPSPLRRRMLEDLRVRKLSDGTQRGYIRAVKRLAEYLGRSPDIASVEDLRRFQLHLVDQGISPITLNATITGLKSFFDVTLDRVELMAKMQPVYVPRTLPVVSGCAEVSRLILAAPSLKHQTALSIAYGDGLRASEVVGFKVSDIDSGRMLLRVERGKGQKDRHALLSPLLLGQLRVWWRRSTSVFRCIPCGTALPPICWNSKSISGSSRCCSDTRSWKPR